MGLGIGARPALAQPAFQAPPVLSARELLPPNMLAGAHFQVDDRVPTDGFLGHFTLRSGFGTFVAPGRELLRIRIAELPAIQHLEATSQSDVFLQAAGNAAAKPVEAVVSLVTDPVDTLRGIPGGVSRFFGRLEMGAKSIAQAASDPTKSEQQRTQEAAQRIGSATITALGFEQARRQLAKGLAVDPYTTNPVLSQKLTDTAWVAFSGRLGVNLLVSAFIPGSTAISGLSFTHDLVYDTPAADLIVLNRQKMIAMGASDARAQALLDNRWYSLSVLTALVTDLERLSGVVGRPEVLALAVDRHEGGGGSVPGGGRPRAGPAQRDRGTHPTGDGPRDRGRVRCGRRRWSSPPRWIISPGRQRAGAFESRADLRAARRGIWLTGRVSRGSASGVHRAVGGPSTT